MALTNLKAPIPKNLIDLLANALNKITSITWGNITGTLSNQTDLQNALNAKQNTLSLTTNSTSGAATLVGSTLNVPNYTPAWGQITGTLSSQTDLQNALNAKENSITTLAVTKGGTGTSTQFTQGSVPFAGASGVYTQDNTNFNYDNTNDVLNVDKIAVNDTYNAGGTPYGLSYTATDTTYEFIFRDNGGNTILSSQTDNIFISSSKLIRAIGGGLGVKFGLSVSNGNGVEFITTGQGVFTGSNNFSYFGPEIKSISSDSQSALFVNHTIEQNSTATGVVKTIHAETNQILNPTRTYSCTSGNNFITITDPRGTADFNNGNTVTGTGIPPATTITSIVGSQINLSNNVTQTLNGELVTNTSVTYTPSNIPDYRALSANVGNSVTQKAIDVREGVTPLFQVAGDGSFAFKGGTLAPAQTGWTISNPVTKRTIDVSTDTLGDLREIVGTLLQDLINKGIIKP